MKLRRTLAGIGAGALLLATAACGGNGTSTGSVATTLTVADASTTLSGMPIGIALKLGYFKDAGLDVKQLAFKNSPESLAALQSGNVDLANSAGSVQMQVNANTNEPGKKLYKVYQVQSKALWRVLVNPNTGVTEGGDLMSNLAKLKGKTVGIPGPGGEGTEVIKYLIEKAGLSDTDVKFITVGVGAPALSAFKAKQVDAVITIPPVNFLLQDAGAVQVYNMATDTELPEFTRWDQVAYVASKNTLDKKAGAMKKFNEALDRAFKYIENPANRDKVISMWQEENPADKALLEKSFDAGVGDYANGDVDCKGVKNAGDFAVLRGLIKANQQQDCTALSWTGIADRLTDK
jgi:NitT/TauT family transport system substrate-binding protein